jgi:hypothetical protein
MAEEDGESYYQSGGYTVIQRLNTKTTVKSQLTPPRRISVQIVHACEVRVKEEIIIDGEFYAVFQSFVFRDLSRIFCAF